jgi:hypothetical protein
MVSIAILTLSTSGSGPGPFIVWDARIKEDVPKPILAALPQANVFLKKSLLSIFPSFNLTYSRVEAAADAKREG